MNKKKEREIIGGKIEGSSCESNEKVVSEFILNLSKTLPLSFRKKS